MRRLAFSLILIVHPAGLAAQLPSVTLYERGTALVRREFAAEVPRGESTLDLTVEDLDPASLFSTDPTIRIHRVEVRGPSTYDEALAAAAGVELTFVTTRGDSARATPVGPGQFRLADGRITYAAPGMAIFPAALAPSGVTLRLHLSSESVRHAIGLGYLVNGGGWGATYQVVVGRGPGRVLGNVLVRGEGLGLDSARVTLASGFQISSPPVSLRSVWRDRESGLVIRGASQSAEGFSSAVLSYTPPRADPLGDGVLYELAAPVVFGVDRLAMVDLLDGIETPVVATFAARSRQTGFTWTDTRPDTLTLTRDYLVRRARGTAFGDRPLPAGQVRILALDAGGRPQLLGNASIDRLDPGEDLVVRTTGATGITVVRRLSNYEQVNPRSAFVTVTTEVTSSLDSAVAIQVFDRSPQGTTITEHSHPFLPGDGDTIRFPVALAARGTVILHHLVRIDR